MKKLFLILLVVILVQNCAYLINKGKQEVSFSGNIDDVEMIVDGNNYGTLPISTKLSRCEDHDIIFESKGYKEKYINLTRKRNEGITFLSAFMFGPIGATIDDSLCALDKFEDSDIFVKMSKN